MIYSASLFKTQLLREVSDKVGRLVAEMPRRRCNERIGIISEDCGVIKILFGLTRDMPGTAESAPSMPRQPKFAQDIIDGGRLKKVHERIVLLTPKCSAKFAGKRCAV